MAMDTATEQALIVDLDQLDRHMIALAGGKGANLGELRKADFPVPPGFCITTNAYRQFVEQAGLEAVIQQALAGLNYTDTNATARAGETIRSAFIAAPVPPALRARILDAVHMLGGMAYAVRSSATAEDLPEASFAGQQDTYLNIVGDEALIDAVRRCWASLWTDRAISYRARQDLDQTKVLLAVIVQQMVQADVAGVLFTANPLTGRRNQIVINANPGLGEAIVAGMVLPDQYIVDKTSLADKTALAIVERAIGTKQEAVRSLPGGGTETIALDANSSGQQALPDAAILALAQLGMRVEQHYGAPQDIEWTWTGEAFALVQSRPITSLFPLPQPEPHDGTVHIYISANAAQGMLEPFTPMGLSIIRLPSGFLQRVLELDGPPMRFAAERAYFDVSRIIRTHTGQRVLFALLSQADPVAEQALRSLLSDPRLQQGTGVTRAEARRRIRNFVRAIWPAPLNLVRYLIDPSRGERILKWHVNPALLRLQAESRSPLDLQERGPYAEALLGNGMRILFPSVASLVFAGMVALAMIVQLARRWGLDNRAVLALRQGLAHNVTTEMDLQLWVMTKKIAALPDAKKRLLAGSPATLAAEYRSGTLPPVVQMEMQAFLKKYGHRGVREIDIGMPRWIEDPSHIFNVLQGYLQMEATGNAALDPEHHFEMLQQAAKAAGEQLVAQAAGQPNGALKAKILSFLIDRYRRLGGYRESIKFYAIWLLRMARVVIAGGGETLARQGRLDSPADVFFLTLAELAPAAHADQDLRALVVKRRQTYEHELNRHQIPRVMTSDGDAIYGQQTLPDSNMLSGVGVSPGVSSGIARVIRDPSGAQLLPGEILVAPSTDPAWTPLFMTAGGLVMEAGGMMSHGSVVARELGIPAVVGVAQATQHLATGMRITVDGNQGLVQIEPEEVAPGETIATQAEQA